LRPIRLLALLLAVVLVAASCSNGNDETSEGSDPSTAGAADTDTGSGETSTTSAEFCIEMQNFTRDQAVTNVANFGSDFFADVDTQLEALVESSPEQLRSDLEVLRKGFAETDRILAGFDYDLSDPQLLPSLEDIDNEGMLQATENIEAHLAEECSPKSAVAAPAEEISGIMEAFGVDEPLARCLHGEFGDLANIDSEDLTPELLTKPACGTALFDLLAGEEPPAG